MTPIIIVRYGELTTKSKNRIDFIKQLTTNIKTVLPDFPKIKIIYYHDRIEIINLEAADIATIIDLLVPIFGISSLSSAFKMIRDMAVLKTNVISLINNEIKIKKTATFKLFVTRSDKTFALTSDAIIQEIAAVILQNTALKVNVINPDLAINLKINKNDIYCYTSKIKGAGGFPTGSAGKILLLLSGGIDSPVAAYKLMKRGLIVDYLHFTTPPYTLPASLNKVKQLVNILAPYNGGMKNLYICNFTNLQNELTHIDQASYQITLMRRMFIRIANLLADKLKIQALATGEALGQVASQTLASINVINSVADFPILRSLITEDKLDIINFAKKIGTYETSILPFADCCSLFVPKKPATKPKIAVAQLLEDNLNQLVDWAQILSDTFNQIEKIL